MKHAWATKNNNSDLLLFFNGWGMDGKPFEHLHSNGLDVLMFYDYTTFEMDVDLGDLCAQYERSVLAAWSLGVWAAARILAKHKENFAAAVAINGTLSPISAEYGIAPKIFQSTIDLWSEATRLKFNRRMCAGRENYEYFSNHLPGRSLLSQQQELCALQENILGNPQIEDQVYDTAVIGLKDQIFTPQTQAVYWQKKGTPVCELDEPHYLFGSISNWGEVAAFGRIG